MEREVWLACAGPFALLPSINTQVYYFPRGHADQCRGAAHLPPPPADEAIPCTVTSLVLEFHAHSDDPCALITLQPDDDADQGPAAAQPAPVPTAARYFRKVLSGLYPQSAPFTFPVSCAERLFPDQEGEILEMVDVHGKSYRIKNLGRYRLSSGWNKYAQGRRLKTGDDAVVVMRRADGGLLLGSRRSGPCGNRGADMFQDVGQAADREPGQPFTVRYYPRQGWAFVVPRKLVDDALQINDWQPGMRIRMPITEDPHELQESRNATNTPDYYYGNVSNVVDNAMWCKLQVAWDERTTPKTQAEWVNVWQVEQFRKRQKTTDAQPSSPTSTPSSSTAAP